MSTTETEKEAQHLRGFQKRVDIAASHIAASRPFTRSLDNCFENYDGDAVAHALFRRASMNPHGKLAKNISDYLYGEVNINAKRDGPSMSLNGLRDMSLKNFRASRAASKRASEDQRRRNELYRSELTDAGEQTVIPGCEADSPQTGSKQMNLF